VKWVLAVRVVNTALDNDGVSIICCPVDYTENLRLTDRLGQVDAPL
jgi:acetolactate synthase-1/2/3 large subunit